MTRLRFVALGLAALMPCAVTAAEITRLATSFEDDHPFGAFLDLTFERTQRKALITHDFHQTNPSTGKTDVVAVNELQYTNIQSKLNLDLRIGLYKDLEFHFGVPIIFQFDENWGFANGTGFGNSTTQANANNCIDASGNLYSPTCTANGSGSQAMFALDSRGMANAYRSGVGNVQFGLAYGLFNQKKDDTKPTWIAGLEYAAPTAAQLDPSIATTTTKRGAIGDRVHQYKFYTALSRKIGAVDPYFEAHYTAAARGPGWYSNCDHAGNAPPGDASGPISMSHPDNCGTAAWSRSDTGIVPPQTGGVMFGTELFAMDDPAKHQRVAFDVRGIANYVGPGRYYNELSGLFGKLMYSDDYLEMGGSLGLNAHASDYVRIQAVGSVLYSTAHSISDEPIGKPLNGDTSINLGNPLEFNPNFDYRADAVSRQFRASNIFTFRLDVTASFNF